VCGLARNLLHNLPYTFLTANEWVDTRDRLTEYKEEIYTTAPNAILPDNIYKICAGFLTQLSDVLEFIVIKDKYVGPEEFLSDEDL